MLRLKALDDVLEEAYSDAEKTSDSDFRLLCDALIRDDALCTLIEDTYDFIMARPNPFGWLHEKCIRNCFKRIWDFMTS